MRAAWPQGPRRAAGSDNSGYGRSPSRPPTLDRMYGKCLDRSRDEIYPLTQSRLRHRWIDAMFLLSDSEAKIMARRDESPGRDADRRSGRGQIGRAATRLPTKE